MLDADSEVSNTLHKYLSMPTPSIAKGPTGGNAFKMKSYSVPTPSLSISIDCKLHLLLYFVYQGLLVSFNPYSCCVSNKSFCLSE